MRCDGVARRLILSLLTVLLLVVLNGAIGAVSADPGNNGLPVPSVPNSPDGTSTLTGSVSVVVDLLAAIAGATLL